MSSKKTSKERRANLPRKFDFDWKFNQDWDRIEKAGKLDLGRLKEVMLLIIANSGPLGPEWKDHKLAGSEWKNCRECHAGGDFLLVYRITSDGGVIFVRTGTHSELFG